MKGTHGLTAATVLALVFVLGCGDDEDARLFNPADSDYAPAIDPANFANSTTIDNRYFPLTPGTTFIYEGQTEDGLERIESFVTHDTKEILGVTCVVVRVRATIAGELVEDTFDWYAQDNDGNVWYFGEDTKSFEDGMLESTAGSWEAGVGGAFPGIIILGDPLVGLSYRQEFFKGEAEDMGQVLSLNESVSVRYGSFDNVLQTLEWTPLEPDVLEHDFYAPGVGTIKEQEVAGGSELIELVDITTG